MPNGNYGNIFQGMNQVAGGLFPGGGSGPYGDFDFDKWWEWFQQQQAVPGVRSPGIKTGASAGYTQAMKAAGGGGRPWMGYMKTVPVYERELMSYLIGTPRLSKGHDPFRWFGGSRGGRRMTMGSAGAGSAAFQGRSAGGVAGGVGKPSPGGPGTVTKGGLGGGGGRGAWVTGGKGPISYANIKGFGFPRNVSPWSILTGEQRDFLMKKWGAKGWRGGEQKWQMPYTGMEPSTEMSRPELINPSAYLKRRIGEYELGIMGKEEKAERLQGIETAIAQKTLGLPEPQRRKAITQAMADGVMKLDIEGAAREGRNMQYILEATTNRISQLQGAVQLAQGWQGQALNNANQAANRTAQMNMALLGATTQKEIANMQGQISVQKTNMLKAMSEKQMAMDWLQFLMQMQYGYWNTQQQIEANEVPGWLQAIMGIGQVAGTAATIIGAFSSKEFKTDIETIDNATEKVNRLRGVSFKWKSNKKPNMGLIAEEVAEVVPEAVIHTSDGKVLGLEYSQLIGLLVEAIKEQQGQIEQLKRGM